MERNLKEHDRRSSRKWNPWPVAIIAYFSVAVTGCVTFVIFCSRHPVDLVAADYYEQEVKYQSRMDSLQAAKSGAVGSHVSYDARAQSIVVSLASAPQQAVSGTIQLYRPSAMNQDKMVRLAPDANGMQKIDAAGLAPGLWKVRVSWQAEQREYLIDQTVVVTRATS